MQVFVCPVVYSRTKNAVAAQAGAVMAEAAMAARTSFFISISSCLALQRAAVRELTYSNFDRIAAARSAGTNKLDRY